MAVREIIGLAAGIVILAGITVAIKNGGQTANVLNAMGNSFANVIRAATGQ